MLEAATAEDPGPLLASWRAGDVSARDRLFTHFYPELRRAAAAMIRRERGLSLSSRDLLNEAVERLIRLERIGWNDRAHFLAMSSRMMRRALLDHARRRCALKRAHLRVELSTSVAGDPDIELQALNEALDRLATVDPVRAEIVEMRYFGGMDIADIAAVLGLSESTVKRRWAGARLWLLEALTTDA